MAHVRECGTRRETGITPLLWFQAGSEAQLGTGDGTAKARSPTSRAVALFIYIFCFPPVTIYIIIVIIINTVLLYLRMPVSRALSG